MHFICVACGKARAKLLYLLNVDHNAVLFQFHIFIVGWAFFLLTCKVPSQCVCLTMEIMRTLGNYKIVSLEGMTTMQRGSAGFLVLCLLPSKHNYLF